MSLLLWPLVALATASEEVVFVLEHALSDSAPFVARGSVVVTPSLSRAKMARTTGFELSPEEVSQLASLVETRGMYRLRARPERGGPAAATSVSACDLARLDFKESLDLQLDAKANLVSVSYRNLPTTPGSCDPPTEVAFESTAFVSLDTVAQIIPVQIASTKPPPGFAEAIKAEGGKEDPDAPPPKKGFFAKYWHIIIPVTLILLTSKADPPAEGQQQQQQQQGVATNAPAQNS